MEDNANNLPVTADTQTDWLSRVLGENPSRLMPKTLKRLDFALANGIEGIYYLLGGGSLQVWNTRRKIIAEKNVRLLVKELESLDDEDITHAPMEIETPILEKLSSCEDENLSLLLIKLLAAAASKTHGYSVHPSMIVIANGISPDEALIINSIDHPSQSFAMLKVRTINTKPEKKRAYKIVRRYCSEFDDLKGIIYPENIDLYLGNLESLGVIEIRDGFVAEFVDGVNTPVPEYEILQNKIETKHPINTDEEYEITRHIIHLTNKGQLFVRALMRIEDPS